LLFSYEEVSAAELLAKPNRDELASRAMRMFSGERTLSCIGESTRPLGFKGAGRSCEKPMAAISSVSRAKGEYCDDGEAPLKVLVGVGGLMGFGGAARFADLMFVYTEVGAALARFCPSSRVSRSLGREEWPGIVRALVRAGIPP